MEDHGPFFALIGTKLPDQVATRKESSDGQLGDSRGASDVTGGLLGAIAGTTAGAFVRRERWDAVYRGAR